MIRVRDLDKSLDFYCGFLGLNEVRRSQIGGEATLVFLADDDATYFIELTHNHDNRDYQAGNQFGHLAFTVPNLETVIKQVEANAWWYRKSKASARTPYIFVRDPDGYDIEILEHAN